MNRARHRSWVLAIAPLVVLAACSDSSSRSCVSSGDAEVCAVSSDGSIQFSVSGLEPGSDLTIDSDVGDPATYPVGPDGGVGGGDGAIGFLSLFSGTEVVFTVVSGCRRRPGIRRRDHWLDLTSCGVSARQQRGSDIGCSGTGEHDQVLAAARLDRCGDGEVGFEPGDAVDDPLGGVVGVAFDRHNARPLHGHLCVATARRWSGSRRGRPRRGLRATR